VLSENGRVLLQNVLELTLLLREQFELVVADLEGVLDESDAEFFLINVGHGSQ